jgi:hypothetical protein
MMIDPPRGQRSALGALRSADRPSFFEDVSVYVMLLLSNKGVANSASRLEIVMAHRRLRHAGLI